MSHLPLNDQQTEQPANDAGYAALMAVKPGERLREARQARKLDIEAAAHQLNLSVSVLKALEQDDYSALPSSTFIKGYIRSYARMLRLPGDELVRAFEYQTGVHSSMDEQHPVPQATKKKSPKLLWLLLVAVVLAVAWLLMSGDEAEPIEPPESQGAVEPIQTQEDLPETAPESQGLQPQEPLEQAAPAPEIKILPPAEETAASNANTDTDTGVAGGDAAQAEPVVDLESTPPASAQGETESAAQMREPQVKSEPELAAAESAPDQPLSYGTITMIFSDDCWVEIRDANEKLIYANLHRAGSEYTNTFPEPIDIKLGNGNAVQLSYNGNPVVFATSKRSNVARLSLGR